MNRTLWLASGSPRRRELLTWGGWTVEVHPPEVDETRNPVHSPVAHAEHLARQKVRTAPEDRLAVAADTVVHIDDCIFEKPIDRDEARAHLEALSGRWHWVTTGVGVARGPTERIFSVSTRVQFRSLGAEEIDRYLATGEADDKAGAYGIQGLGGALVRAVEGSWTNVMGLPLAETLAALEDCS
jgi:septum formation protein